MGDAAPANNEEQFEINQGDTAPANNEEQFEINQGDAAPADNEEHVENNQGDAAAADDNEEHVEINQGGRWRMMTCPICNGAHFQTYGRLLIHMAWPPNCFQVINERNQLLQDGQAGPVIVPVVFPLRLVLMLLWIVVWLIYQLGYIIVIPIWFICVGIYHIIATVVLFVANLIRQTYNRVIPAPPPGGYVNFILETAQADAEHVVNFLEQHYANVADMATVARGAAANAIPILYHRILVAPFTWVIEGIVLNVTTTVGDIVAIHRELTLGIIYISQGIANGARYVYGGLLLNIDLAVGGTATNVLYIYGGIATAARYVSGVCGRMSQAINAAYHRNVTVPAVRFRINYIDPLIDFVLYVMIDIPERLFEQARHLFFVRLPTAIDAAIAPEIALAQRIFRGLENGLELIYQKIEWLNSIMYSFFYFPLDIPADAPPLDYNIYLSLYYIHRIIFTFMCVCSFLQLCVLFVIDVYVYLE
ncbi:hypothetical protein MBANPS3_004145 [Mucor bainieri]